LDQIATESGAYAIGPARRVRRRMGAPERHRWDCADAGSGRTPRWLGGTVKQTNVRLDCIQVYIGSGFRGADVCCCNRANIRLAYGFAIFLPLFFVFWRDFLVPKYIVLINLTLTEK
jgi:hypothetical protein